MGAEDEKDITLFKPNWLNLKFFFKNARNIFVCTPWISKEGISFLRGVCERNKIDKAEIWTRLEPSDYAMGISDYVGLLAFINEKKKDIEFSIKTASNLHLKIYKVDSSKVIITSANLTNGGFEDNIEVGVLITNKKFIGALETCLKSLETKLHQVTIEEFENFVRGLGKIEDLRRNFETWKSVYNERSKKLKTYPPKTTKKISRLPYISLR